MFSTNKAQTQRLKKKKEKKKSSDSEGQNPNKNPIPHFLDPTMAAFMGGSGRFREFLKKYGKVAMGVHFSVSAASISGLYVAIKSNVDVESILQNLHMGGLTGKDHAPEPETSSFSDGFAREEEEKTHSTVLIEEKQKKRNRTAELAASSGGALALAVLCNKALFPIRVPITIALTPPVARFLARRKIIKTNV